MTTDIFYGILLPVKNIFFSLFPGAAIGFKLDSLLKLTDTRARNNKMTLMHYLCKVFICSFLLRSTLFSIAMVFGSNSIYFLDINLCTSKAFWSM